VWKSAALLMTPLGCAVAMAWCAYEFPHAWIFGFTLLLISVGSIVLGGLAVRRGLRRGPRVLSGAVAIIWAVAALLTGEWMLGWMVFGNELHDACHRDWQGDCSRRRFERLCRTVHDCPVPLPTEPGFAGVDTPRCTEEERVDPGNVYCGIGPHWLDIKLVVNFPDDGGVPVHACRLDTHR
jgi:hypothetical protein